MKLTPIQNKYKVQNRKLKRKINQMKQPYIGKTGKPGVKIVT